MNRKIVASNTGESVSSAISRSATSTDRIDIAVAFLSDADLIEGWLRRGILVRLLVALQPPTDPLVLRRLLNSFPVGLQTCFYSARFHSKLVIFWKNGEPTAAHVGSSNFTGGGLYSNIETNVLIKKRSHLAELTDHFKWIWEQSALLQPTDVDAYEKYWCITKAERDKLKRKQTLFEGRVVLPRTRGVRRGRIRKEARDYFGFWKVVDQVVTTVRSASLKHWPSVPVYLRVDHFWHWLVRVWDQRHLQQIRASAEFRKQILPTLFDAYATWDKAGSNYTGSRIGQDSAFMSRVLSRNMLPRLTRKLARDVYRRLHSGYMRTRRFASDKSFVKENSIGDIRRALSYLLWSNDDVPRRISALLSDGGRLHLAEFGSSSIQEILGWVNPASMPLRNDKADRALELLGYRFR